MNRSAIIEDVLKSEGGSTYTNRPNDAGGPTKYGITIPALADFLDVAVGNLTANNIRSLDDQVAKDFYNWLFEKNRCHKLPELLQHAFFDTSVLHGFGGASKLLQRALVDLNVLNETDIDGDAGNKTFAAAKCVEPKKLLDLFLEEREKFYYQRVIERPADEENLQGWLNRLNRLRERP